MDVLMTDLGHLKDEMKDLDLKGALREAFGKCPKCASPLTKGHWLKLCPKRSCGWFGL